MRPYPRHLQIQTGPTLPAMIASAAPSLPFFPLMRFLAFLGKRSKTAQNCCTTWSTESPEAVRPSDQVSCFCIQLSSSHVRSDRKPHTQLPSHHLPQHSRADCFFSSQFSCSGTQGHNLRGFGHTTTPFSLQALKPRPRSSASGLPAKASTLVWATASFSGATETSRPWTPGSENAMDAIGFGHQKPAAVVEGNNYVVSMTKVGCSLCDTLLVIAIRSYMWL